MHSCLFISIPTESLQTMRHVSSKLNSVHGVQAMLYVIMWEKHVPESHKMGKIVDVKQGIQRHTCEPPPWLHP